MCRIQRCFLGRSCVEFKDLRGNSDDPDEVTTSAFCAVGHIYCGASQVLSFELDVTLPHRYVSFVV